eukprot:2553787-Amphidinium_carterae.3
MSSSYSSSRDAARNSSFRSKSASVMDSVKSPVRNVDDGAADAPAEVVDALPLPVSAFPLCIMLWMEMKNLCSPTSMMISAIAFHRSRETVSYPFLGSIWNSIGIRICSHPASFTTFSILL